MDQSANDPESLSWYARILAEIADTLLDSADITQALTQAQTDASVLRNLVVNNSDHLMSSSTTPPLEFVERVESELLLSPRYLRFAIAGICILLLFIITSISVLHSPVIISDILFVAILLVVLISGGMLLAGPRIIKPVDTTRDALRREVVGPFLREQINNILAEQEQKHSDVMRITTAPGLADLSDREQLVTTDSMEETVRLCTSMSSGSIGVSGPRGVGKTTLLRYFCDPLLGATASASGSFRGFSDLRIFVSAPVEYDTKDFVLHLFGKLCQTIIEAERSLNPDVSYIQEGRRRGRLASLLAACVLVTCGLGLIVYALFRPKHIPELTKSELYLCVGALFLVMGISIFVRSALSSRFAHRSSARTVSVIDEARAWLTRISYLQTLTSGYAGSVKIPAGLGLEVTSGRQLSELEFTLPDLIDRYKTFAERAIRSRGSTGNLLRTSRESQEQYVYIMERRATILHEISESLQNVVLVGHLAGLTTKLEKFIRDRVAIARETLSAVPRQYVLDYGPRILIGIDEVDKIDADSAQRFLSDIKAIFGVPNCLYLVSVSDEALAVFEQRVLLGRTAFDSSFDEVMSARELDFESCRYLLRRRIAGMPDSLIAFCEIMSGGLPRDLIRMARSVVEASARGQTSIEDLTLSVVSSQVEILKSAFIAEMGSGAYKNLGSRFPESLLENDWLRDSAQSTLAVFGGMTDAQFPMSFRAALYFYATVAEGFSGKMPDRHGFLRGYSSEDTVWIDRLAQARNMISANGDIAWESISRFRITCGLRMVGKSGPPS